MRIECPLCPRVVEEKVTEVCYHCDKRYCLDCMGQQLIHYFSSKLVWVCDVCEEKHY